MTHTNSMLKKALALSMTLILTFSLFACSKIDNEEPSETKPVSTTEETKPKSQYTLYIGSDSNGYKEYDSKITGELSPEKLIEAIADLTGWNLELSEEVSTGKGGMTVVFSKNSFVVVGPPEEQKDEFHVHDNFSLMTTVLDSIKKTLQMNYVMEPGDPNSLDIYFNLENEPIQVEDITIPLDKPWDSKMLSK